MGLVEVMLVLGGQKLWWVDVSKRTRGTGWGCVMES